jgi:hypothetical protein
MKIAGIPVPELLNSTRDQPHGKVHQHYATVADLLYHLNSNNETADWAVQLKIKAKSRAAGNLNVKLKDIADLPHGAENKEEMRKQK